MLELHSSIIATLLNQQSLREKAKQQKQLADLQEKLAKYIAIKMRKHYEANWTDIADSQTVGATLLTDMPEYDDPESPFWRQIRAHMLSDNAQAAAAASAAAVGGKQGNAKNPAFVEAELVPRASEMDSRGRMIGSQETIPVAEKHKSVIIPFQEWLQSKVVNEDKHDTAKRALLHCVFSITQQLRRRKLPVLLQKRDGKISVVAEKNLEVGELVLPLFIRRSTSIIEPGEGGASHNNSLTIDVEWQECNTTEQMEAVGIEEAITHNTLLIVKEEIRLPEEGAAEKDWT